MAYFGSPQIVTNGLAFYYDMYNTQKSFKGTPTTNLVTNAATMASFGNYSNGPTSTFLTEFGTTGWRMSSAGSWNGTAMGGISIPSTGTYTFSAWFRYWGGSANNNGAQCYVSGWGGGDSAVGIDKSKIGIWQRVSITLNVTTASCTLYLISYGGTNGADNSTWDVTMPQVEAGSVATPWVNGTRSNTQALLDLTKNYTLTANSLVYNTDNTFSFAGSHNIDLNSTSVISGTNPFTIESWTNLTSGSYGAIFGNYGSGYTSGSLWWATAGLYINGSVYHSNYATTMAGIHHSAVTRDGSGSVVLYRDGVQVATGTLTASIPSNINWRIGTDVNGTGEAMNGNIYNVRVYNRVLTAAEIAQNFNAQRSRYGL
jgi:hypothetical protein